LEYEERRTRPRRRRRRRREKWGNNEYYIYCIVDGEEINMMDLQDPRQCQSVRILLRL
jgi:hypothetical protein